MVREKDLLEKFLPMNGIVFDVDTRIGAWTLSSIALRNITYSFEPIYESVVQLENNITLNGYENYSQVVNVAESNTDGYKRFHYAGHPSRAAISEVGESNIQTITLDSFIKENRVARVDFIKIDVEGEELAVIEGAVDTIRTMLPDMDNRES